MVHTDGVPCCGLVDGGVQRSLDLEVLPQVDFRCGRVRARYANKRPATRDGLFNPLACIWAASEDASSDTLRGFSHAQNTVFYYLGN